MPRDRFARMKPEAQEALLSVARETFAAFGFEKASLNTLLQSLGMSKGAFYHTFHDKEDLYCEVVLTLAKMLPDLSPSARVQDAAGFWTEVEERTMSVYALVSQDRELEVLLKDVLQLYSNNRFPDRLQKALTRLEEGVLEWVLLGQEVGAVRKDVPTSLISRMWIAAGSATDVWMMQQADQGKAMTALVPAMEMMRRLVSPPKGAQ